jgi:hypothetical protein
MNTRARWVERLLLSLCFSLTILAPLSAQIQEKTTALKPGPGMEFFSRTIQWDEGKNTSSLKSFLFTFHLDYALQQGFEIGLQFGFSLSDFRSMVFRQLPFSIEYEAGNNGGFLAGASIRKRILETKSFEMDVEGQFVAFLGMTRQWKLTDLNTEGQVEGKPYWMRALIGPTFFYRGVEYFYPYLHLSVDKLWGKFTMNQAIEDLTGREEKQFSSKSFFGISLGAIYEASDRFHLQGEGRLMPYNGGLDYGLMFKARYVL